MTRKTQSAKAKSPAPNTSPGQGAKETTAEELAKDQAAKDGAPNTGEATKPTETKAEAVKGTVETRPDNGEPGEQIDGQGLAPAADAGASESAEKINTAAQDGPVKAAMEALGNPGEIPALFIRTKRRFKSRRRAGFRFSREGYGIALEALSEEQIAAIKADPALEVEECTFPAEEAEA
ncbi:hypothetical protein HOP54_02395 [Halomonas daqingensis]|uniref:hypothetical protein n=1 Tax=Billgrantia desiderata TaxID=52021 RepID=UPI001F221B89|nr:hypothetical protein [Halomonas desiderata]MCE8027539.1 hypothetical protein [Halomonas desiderata]